MPKLVLALISILIIGGTSIFFFSVYKNSSANIVVFDGNTFSPAELTVIHGDTVVFVNKSDTSFWPASNLHPSHLVWSEFDPKKPIEAGESWSFTFTKEGEWGYHDHIKSTIKGKIIVLAKDGETIAGGCEDGQNKQKCWETSILDALEEGGVDRAFDVFTSLYDSDQEFANSCHSFVHLIGERSYDQFVNHEEFKLSPKTQFCGYGFFHGFMETLLIQSGDIELSREFCAHVDATLSKETPSAWKACYHGIGHGAIDGGDPRDWGNALALVEPGLALCDQIGITEFEKHLCGTGVFNGIAVAFDSGDYGLTASKENVFDLCESLPDPLYKPGCYDQMNTLIFALADQDVTEALALINTMKEREFFENALSSLASTFGRPDMTQEDFDDLIQSCGQIEQPSRGSCIGGFATGLVEYGSPGEEYVVAMDFCRSKGLGDLEKEQCFNSVVLNSTFIFPEEKIQDICNLVAEEVDIKTVTHCKAGQV